MLHERYWEDQAVKAKAELDRLQKENAELHEMLEAALADAKDYMDIVQERDRLRAELAKRQWQSIDTAPLELKWLLMWDGAHYHIATRGLRIFSRAIHWMPLPAPPDGG